MTINHDQSGCENVLCAHGSLVNITLDQTSSEGFYVFATFCGREYHSFHFSILEWWFNFGYWFYQNEQKVVTLKQLMQLYVLSLLKMAEKSKSKELTSNYFLKNLKYVWPAFLDIFNFTPSQ